MKGVLKAMKKHRLDFESIKQNFRIIDVVQQLGFTPEQSNSHEWRCISTEANSHNATALSIDTDKNIFHDFKNNTGGSVLDLVALVKFGRIDTETIYQAAQFLAGDKYEVDSKYWQAWQRQREAFIKQIKTAHEFLMSDDAVAVYTREYLHSRSITDDTMRKFLIGLCAMPINYGNEWINEPRLIIPYLDRAGVPFYAAHRRLDKYCRDIKVAAKYKKLPLYEYGYIHNGACGLFTLSTTKEGYDIIIVNEGAIDWLSTAQAGYHCLSPVSGYFGKENEEEVISEPEKEEPKEEILSCYFYFLHTVLR